MRGLGLTAAGAAAATALGTSPSSANSAAQDILILQFALNLEYLEAEFYLRAASGSGLGPSVTGNASSTVILPPFPTQVQFNSSLVAAYAQEIAEEERKHVLFLRAALGSSVINEPVIDLYNSFDTLGQAAGFGAGYSPFKSSANDLNFLLGAYIFEDVGVTAYHGAATYIQNPAYLDAAAGILAVEAYHAGLIRTILFADGAANATQAISGVRAMLDGTLGTANIDDQGVGTTQLPHIVLSTDPRNAASGGPGNNAIAYDRLPSKVLKIVYGNAAGTPALFFPKGINGAAGLP
jgi:Ferritin-like domain